jgi:hypothetical protein
MTVAAVAAPTVASAASTAKLWQNKAHTVTCGIEIHAPKKPADTLLCGARGIPRPKNGGPAGDPFVQITKRGRAQLVLISQASWVGKRTATLRTGATWSSVGVTCTIAAKTVTCKNKSRHGFTIGNRKYKSF